MAKKTCGKCKGMKIIECPDCEGTTQVVCECDGDDGDCEECDGTGEVECLECDGTGEIDCPVCKGAGEVDDEEDE